MTAAASQAAVGYIRSVSGGLDPAAQRQRVEAYCKQHGLELVKLLGEHPGQEQAAHERQELREAVELATQRRGVLVVASLACLARSALTCISVAEDLRRAGAHLVAIDDQIDTTADAAFFRVMQALATLEIEHDRLAYRPPFGFELADDGQHILTVPSEQAVIRQMVEWHAHGASYDEIAGRLNDQRAASRDPAGWTAAAVQRVIEATPTSRWDAPTPRK